MSRVARILVSPRSGMTTAATAMASGLIGLRLNTYLVVATEEDKKLVPKVFPRQLILVVSNADAFLNKITTGHYESLCFDDFERCQRYWNRQRHGELVNCILQRFERFDDDITRLYLFEYQ